MKIVYPPDYGPTIPGADAGAMVPMQTIGGALVVDPGVPLHSWTDPGALGVEQMLKRHPSVRKVTSFIASNIASIPLHVYERVGDTDRRRVTDGPLAALLSNPGGPGITPFRFWEAVTMDGLIFDRVCIMIDESGPDGLRLVRIPPSAWRMKRNGLGFAVALEVYDGTDWLTVPESERGSFLVDTGYHTGGSTVSPLESLRIPIEDYLEEAGYRRDVWAKGPRFGGIVERDTKWPNETARSRFLTGLAMFNRAGHRSGSTMLLDDGMTWKDVQGVTPKDVASTEARRLSDVEVASAYHIAPELVGAREGTFANIEAFRQALYSVALAPYIVQWEQMIAPLVARYGGANDYIEANVQAKLRGSFAEQASLLQTATGGPYMTRNEGRARLNLPAIDGGDELIVPLNVITGGQASPTDSAPPPKAAGTLEHGAPVAPHGVKGGETGADDEDRDGLADVLRAFWDRQEAAVVAAIENGDDDWWDKTRWDKDLAADLLDAALSVSGEVGRATAKRLGADPSAYSVARTVAYLTATMGARAEWINDTTRDDVADALASDDEDDTPGARFEYARENRAVAAAAAVTTYAAAFAQTEAAKQTGQDGATKTWVVESSNPRASHIAMDGETVPVGDTFSNGMKWPGDPSGGADEVAGCMCSLIINTP